MQELTQAIEAISQAPSDVKVRITRRIEVGQAIHQGDVYVHRVPDFHPRGKPTGERQVAVGTTVGARHVAEGEAVIVHEGRQYPEGFTAPPDMEENEMLGPVVKSTEAWTLTHPEHAHHRLPAGTYQVTYQLDPQTRRRVLD